jgi:hypothetical protein
MVTRRHCGVCKAPFHERLYDLFGLHPYMPISWELNQENAPTLRHLWDDDLVWSWRIHDHSHNKSNLSSEFLWEDDHEEIVRVCQKLIGFGTHNEGQRNFFYQWFNGQWDELNGRFQFGPHPDGWMWNGKGELIIDGVGNIPEDIHLNLMLSTSEWIQRFKGEAVDYLLEKHSPETLRTLEWLKNSEFLQAILEVDGPAHRTQLQTRRRLVPEGEDDKVPQGRNDNKAGPSGTSSDIV